MRTCRTAKAVEPRLGDHVADDDEGCAVDRGAWGREVSVLEKLATLLEIEGVEFGALESEQLGLGSPWLSGEPWLSQ